MSYRDEREASEHRGDAPQARRAEAIVQQRAGEQHSGERVLVGWV